MTFRLDINGLRAYAVLAVIIFHFNKEWLPGGFAGVDVFFVISGFLMTSIIVNKIVNKEFSLFGFYLARVRRIVPALTVLIMILFLVGYLVLAPYEYLTFSKHALSSLIFLSNFFFWSESGYFNADAIDKVLLHTWSLAVEWQFYLLYPILLLVLFRIVTLNRVGVALVCLTMLSFCFSIYASLEWPTFSYFLLPTRIWEMSLCGVAYFFQGYVKSNRYVFGIELIGLALVIASFFSVTELTLWPGYMALLPTIVNLFLPIIG